MAALFAAAKFAPLAAAKSEDWQKPDEVGALSAHLAADKAKSTEARRSAAVDLSATQRLLRFNSRENLETLYKSKESKRSEPLPDGMADGTATRSPGTGEGGIGESFYAFLWKWKIFDGKNATLVDELPEGRDAILAKVSYGESWLDGKISIIVHYEDPAGLAVRMRDEIRMVAPNLYLGFSYTRTADAESAHADLVFALDFSGQSINKPKAALGLGHPLGISKSVPPLNVSLRTELAGLRGEAAGPRGWAAGLAQEPQPPMQPLLRRNSREALEALYKSKEPGPIPDGVSDGVATNSPGTWRGWIKELLSALLWKGKIFDRENGTLINRFPFGIKTFKAKVYYGESWLDGKPSIIVDYQDTSGLVGWIRDEIRMVAPGLYLGLAYARTQDGTPPRARVVFTLDFNAPKASKPEPPATTQKTADLQTP